MNKAEAIGNKDFKLNKSVPGLIIIKTTINPTIIAKVLCIPIFSPNIGTANKPAIKGAE